ncbi:MAG: hypothetical protein H6611_03690 [Ignavibacteriales bacterium]|nr:hypothetical protein [Ignavibacteriales bacterium]
MNVDDPWDKGCNHANYNNDMMDDDGCKNVIISDCFGDTDDDGITLKGTSKRITEKCNNNKLYLLVVIVMQ